MTKTTMHFAFVSTHYYPRVHGGAEHSLQLQAEALVELGFRVSVLSLHDGTKPERFQHRGVECHALPAPNLRRCLSLPQRASVTARGLWHLLDIYNPIAGRLLERELRALQPDLVHTVNLPGWSCAAWAAVRRCRLPLVQVLHDYQLTCPVATRSRQGRNCAQTCAGCVPFAAVRGRASQRVSYVVANSRYTRAVHQSLGFFGRARIFDVIYGSVPALSGTRADAPDATLRIGYIGRLHPTKGVELLIDAFRAANRSDVLLRIAGLGEPAYRENLKARAAGARVEFVGHAPMAEFLPSLDVLVVPSRWNEPMGRVVIEAARAGVPVIAAERGGIPELVRPGQTGWLFDPDRPGELTAQLRDLELNTLRSMQPACSRWGDEFSNEKITARWLQFYAQIAAQTDTIDPALSASNSRRQPVPA